MRAIRRFTAETPALRDGARAAAREVTLPFRPYNELGYGEVAHMDVAYDLLDLLNDLYIKRREGPMH